MNLTLILSLVLALSHPTSGALTQHDLSTVGAAPAPGAALPLSLSFRNEAGAPVTLQEAMGGRPTLLVFADYTCKYLCGPGLVLTAMALDHTTLKPGRDYSFVVVGINPRDGPAQARAMRAARLHPGAGAAAQLLSDGPADRAAAALGYRYLYDPAQDQYAHDTSVYVLRRTGEVGALLPQFALTSAALSRAIAAARAPDPPAAAWPAPLRFICYCLQPLTGAFDDPVVLALRIGGVGFVAAAAAAGFIWLRARERRA